MRKRLCFLLPDIDGTRNLVNELLIASIDDYHIHVIAKDDINLGDLPEASINLKPNFIHSMETGMLIGGLLGLLSAIIFIYTLQFNSIMSLVALVFTITGAVTGIWISGIITEFLNDFRLKIFKEDINAGKILVIADVPVDKIKLVNETIKIHTQINLCDPNDTIPAY